MSGVGGNASGRGGRALRGSSRALAAAEVRGGGGAGDPDNRFMLACGLRNLRSIIYLMHHLWVCGAALGL